jgi:hypothetical protein
MTANLPHDFPQRQQLSDLLLNAGCSTRRDLKNRIREAICQPLSRWTCGSSEQGGRFNLVEGAVHQYVLPRSPDPWLSVRCAGQAKGFGQSRIHLSVLQFGKSAHVARVGLNRWTVRPADLDERAKFTLELRPPAFLGRGRPQGWPEIAIFGYQLVELNLRV